MKDKLKTFLKKVKDFLRNPKTKRTFTMVVIIIVLLIGLYSCFALCNTYDPSAQTLVVYADETEEENDYIIFTVGLDHMPYLQNGSIQGTITPILMPYVEFYYDLRLQGITKFRGNVITPPTQGSLLYNESFYYSPGEWVDVRPETLTPNYNINQLTYTTCQMLVANDSRAYWTDGSVGITMTKIKFPVLVRFKQSLILQDPQSLAYYFSMPIGFNTSSENTVTNGRDGFYSHTQLYDSTTNTYFIGLDWYYAGTQFQWETVQFLALGSSWFDAYNFNFYDSYTNSFGVFLDGWYSGQDGYFYDDLELFTCLSPIGLKTIKSVYPLIGNSAEISEVSFQYGYNQGVADTTKDLNATYSIEIKNAYDRGVAYGKELNITAAMVEENPELLAILTQQISNEVKEEAYNRGKADGQLATASASYKRGYNDGLKDGGHNIFGSIANTVNGLISTPIGEGLTLGTLWSIGVVCIALRALLGVFFGA